MGIYQGDERSERAVLALVAHDEKKDDLLQLATRHRSTLAKLRLIATGHTGGQIAAALDIDVERVHSGPEGAISRSALASWRATSTPWCSCGTR
jgi:methylglyoxal synthase